MTARGIITFIIVLIIIALGASAIFILNKNKASQNPTTKTTTTTTKGATTQPANNSAVVTTQGKLIIGVKDATANMAGISSVVIFVEKAEIHNQAQQWIGISTQVNQYDLLALKKSEAISLLTQTNVSVGTYDQMRLTVGKILVTKNGAQSEAQLPSHELTVTANMVIEANKTSTAVFDFIADESLHITGDGRFIFAPVIKVQTQSSSDASVDASNQVHMTARNADANINAGMDVDGQMKMDFLIGSNIKLNLVGNVIKVGTLDESDKTIKIDANGAINAAISGKYLDTATSVALVSQTGKKIWVVGGLKNLTVISVDIDAITGALVTY